jgi:hypothetical protein
MSKYLSLLSMLVIIAGSAAHAGQTLPVLVDGAPWQVQAPDGMNLQMTFSPDGKGQVKVGFMSNDVTWSVQDGNFCIGGRPVGTACMTLSVDGKTVIGNSTDGKKLVFWRA